MPYVYGEPVSGVAGRHLFYLGDVAVNLEMYMREAVWAVRSADPQTSAVLIANTLRHHVANWLKRWRNNQTFTVDLDLGAPRKSTVTLRSTGGDLSILYEVFAEETYHIPDETLPPDSVLSIVDCGAHVGLSALYLANRYPKARVIAIEPNPVNFQLLTTNTKQESRIVPVRACISDHSGMTLIETHGPGWGHMTGRCVGVEVEAVTLRDVRSRFGIGTIDLLKIDVEGDEKRVFAGGLADPIRAIAAEIHNTYTVADFTRDVAPLKVTSKSGCASVYAISTGSR